MFLPSSLGGRTHVIIFRLSLQAVCCVQVRWLSSTDGGFFMLSVSSQMPFLVVSVGILQSCECTRQYLAVAIGRATTGFWKRRCNRSISWSFLVDRPPRFARPRDLLQNVHAGWG